jgi:hypothetical protein
MSLALLSSCESVNHYQQAYRSTLQPGGDKFLLPHAGEPQVLPVTGTLDQSVAKQELRGYLVVGYATFVADADNYHDSLLAQARAVSADIVLATEVPAGVRSDVDTQGGFETGKDHSNMSSVPAGTARAGSDYSRPSGFSTPTYVARDVAQNKYVSVFLRKRALVLGATVEPAALPLPAGTAAAFGMEVKTVIEDSPAYFADIHVGDILTAVEGKTFATKEDYQLLMNAHAGTLTSLSVLRKGVERPVTVKLNPLPKQQ